MSQTKDGNHGVRGGFAMSGDFFCGADGGAAALRGESDIVYSGERAVIYDDAIAGLKYDAHK